MDITEISDEALEYWRNYTLPDPTEVERRRDAERGRLERQRRIAELRRLADLAESQGYTARAAKYRAEAEQL